MSLSISKKRTKYSNDGKISNKSHKEKVEKQSSTAKKQISVAKNASKEPSTTQPTVEKQPNLLSKCSSPPSKNETEVPIPLTETPMIRKNTNIRKQRRRSSLDKRGKRASSIGNGFIAKPHPDISHKEFYRHIQPDLPGPIRLRQLLAWCGQRTLENQKSEYENAFKIAKILEADILNDIMDSKINTSWYHRNDGQDLQPLKKRPHQQNIENQNKLKELEPISQRLKAEIEEWDNLINGINHFHSSIVKVAKKVSQGSNQISLMPNEVDMSVLHEDQRKFLLQYCTDNEKTQLENNYLEQMMDTIEVKVDNLYALLYNASLYNTATQTYCEDLLVKLLAILRRRQEKSSGINIETNDVLKALSRV
ncbi:Mis12-Mtw1 protein family-domain-containing protein [Rhizophagus diaphanus]|nr:Mis12-Mtw1 protein family-domain-containing protein [Rhizophagus diaphanus] [Rhizophagus sp. MUCL 43196]